MENGKKKKNEKDLLQNKQVPSNEEKEFNPLDFIMSDKFDPEELKRRAPLLVEEDPKFFDLLSSKELDLDKIISMMEEKLKDFQKDTKDTDPALIASKLILANLYHENGQCGNAVEMQEGQVEPARVYFAEMPEVVFGIQSKLGIFYQDLGCYEKAEKVFKEVIDSAGKRFGSENKRVLDSQVDLAIVYRLWGRHEESSVLLERSLDVMRQKMVESPRNVAMIESTLGLNYTELGRYEEGITVLIKSEKRIVDVVGKEDPDAVSIGLNFLFGLLAGMRADDPFCLALGQKLKIVLPDK